jgi:signal transduction histidine kinase
MLGYRGENTSPVRQLLQDHFADQQDWRYIGGMIGREGFCASVEVDVKRLDGSRFKTLFSGSLDRDPAQNQETLHFLVKDIDHRKSMEQQMAQADKLASIGQLAAGIAHEINNPLGIILGYTQLLLRGEQAGDERYSDLKTIEKHVRNCKLIVEDLLNFARSSETEKEAVSIHRAIDDVLNFIQHHSDLGRIEVVRRYAKNIPAVLLDEKKIKQVLINLIMNAKDAVGQAGTITLGTEYDSEGCQVLIRVSDTGYGIEEKNLSRIFDPFFTTKPTGEATGLGLSVSYAIVKSQGGDISVQSRPGRGTVFTVELPIK